VLKQVVMATERLNRVLLKERLRQSAERTIV
jgi:hypothetical protein